MPREASRGSFCEYRRVPGRKEIRVMKTLRACHCRHGFREDLRAVKGNSAEIKPGNLTIYASDLSQSFPTVNQRIKRDSSKKRSGQSGLFFRFTQAPQNKRTDGEVLTLIRGKMILFSSFSSFSIGCMNLYFKAFSTSR